MTLNDKLAALFKANPNTWLDGRQLAAVGGYAGWRNRLTDLRLIYGMSITNRKRYPKVAGRTITVSEYIYQPLSEPEQLPLSDQWSVGA